MIIKSYLECSHCKKIAHEYEGLEGGVYISFHYKCDKNSSKKQEHDFIKITDKIKIKQLDEEIRLTGKNKE